MKKITALILSTLTVLIICTSCSRKNNDNLQEKLPIEAMASGVEVSFRAFQVAFEEVANTYNNGTTKITNVDGKVLDLTKVSSKDFKYPKKL